MQGQATNYRNNKLEIAGNDPIQGNIRAFAVRMSDGSVKTWGDPYFGGDSSSVQSSLNNVKALCASWGDGLGFSGGAFAAIVGNKNKVICWGHKGFGGDCSAVAGELKQVEGICGSESAFAALKRDGTVTTWGNEGCGGDSSSVRSRLKGVKAIYSTHKAFAAVLDDGSVEAWGHQGAGGLIPPSVKARLKQVKCISAASHAFAALLHDGTVETWGDKDYGGDSSELKASNQLTQVEAICASRGTFAALKKNGTVVSWGHRVPVLDRVVALSSTSWAFAALRSDGSVATWGHPDSGGDSSSVAGELKEVVAIRGTGSAFAALREDGTVVTWGNKDCGDSSKVRGELIGVVALSSSGFAFAAQRRDGTVVTWGHKGYGGDSSSVPELRQAGATLTPGGHLALESKQKEEEEQRQRRQQEEEEERRTQQEAQERLREKEREEEEERKKEINEELQRQRQEWEQERNRLEQERESLLRERELWQQTTPQQAVPRAPAATPRDGSEEFWLHTLSRLAAIGFEEEDMAEAASKLSAARFRQRHVGKLSRDDLVLAKVAPAVMKDLLDHQHLLLEGGSSDNSNAEQKNPEAALFGDLSSLLVAPRIPEEELTMEEEVGEGAFSVVWRATWTRKVAVGTQRVHSMQVAVKMSNKANKQNNNNNKQLAMLARDLAVISGLPHQNIVTVHGVCEPSLLKQQQQKKQNKRSNHNNGGNGGLKIVYELMSTDLAKLLQEALERDQLQPSLLPTQLLLRVLRDVSAGLAHLHANGVIHRDVKPANVLLRDEQVKLCDFGSSRNLQHTIQQMTMTGTLDYMSPEMLNKQPVGRPADVWSFGVLLFECVTGVPCGRAQSIEELIAELSNKRKCLPALVQLFAECHQVEPRVRPSMLNIHTRLQTLVMQEARDSQRLREELKRAEAQDKETYEVTWAAHYANQPHSQELLGYLRQVHSQQSPKLVVRQPLLLAEGKGSMEELEQLATGRVCSELHTQLKAMVEESGGIYLCAPRKSSKRCVQKVDQEYGGDYGKLLDLGGPLGCSSRQRTCCGACRECGDREKEKQKRKDMLWFTWANHHHLLLLLLQPLLFCCECCAARTA